MRVFLAAVLWHNGKVIVQALVTALFEGTKIK